MSTIRETLKRATAGSVLVAAALFAGSANAPAQELDLEQQILKSLMPVAKPTLRPPTRSLTATPADPARSVAGVPGLLKIRTSRSLRPTSAANRRNRQRQAERRRRNQFRLPVGKNRTRGRSLRHGARNSAYEPRAQEQHFYPRRSYRRQGQPGPVRAARRRDQNYLVDRFRIPASTLVTVGYGKTELETGIRSFAGENQSGSSRRRGSQRTVTAATFRKLPQSAYRKF